MRAAYSVSRRKSPSYMLLQGKFCNIGNCIIVKKCCLNTGMCKDAGCWLSLGILNARLPNSDACQKPHGMLLLKKKS